MNTNKMKKMMITAAIVCAAVAAQAGTITWKASNIYSSDCTSLYKGEVQLFRYLKGESPEKAELVGTVTASEGTFEFSDSDTRLQMQTYWECYFQIVEGTKMFTSDTMEIFVKGMPLFDIVSFGSMAKATKNPDNWGNAPEPTSGLLMLLGVAGLALKRKRA